MSFWSFPKGRTNTLVNDLVRVVTDVCCGLIVVRGVLIREAGAVALRPEEDTSIKMERRKGDGLRGQRL